MGPTSSSKPEATDSSPRISIIIFCRNAAATIEQALASVAGDHGAAVEILVMDGGSTDGTVEIIRRYEHSIAYWRSFPDGGPENAINEGFERATGEVVCLLPADDWFEEGAIALIAGEFAADPALDVLTGGARIVHHDAGGRLVVDTEFLDADALEFNLHNLVRWPLTNARFIRRRAYRKVGVQNPDFRMSADMDLLIRICLARPKCKVVPRLVYTYRRHPQSRTLGGHPDMIMAMMRGNIQVAAQHLATSEMTAAERGEMVGLHGRASARLAWMCAVRGDAVAAMKAVAAALRQDPLWPLHVIQWSVRYFSRAKPFAQGGVRCASRNNPPVEDLKQ